MTLSDLYPNFKVTILFDVKKRENGTRWIYSYNGWPIESRIWSIERRNVQWSWTTPNTDFKVTQILLQAHRSVDKCLACCLYSDGVVQAVTFGYLFYWLVPVMYCILSLWRINFIIMETGNEPTMMKIAACGPRGRTRNDQLWGTGGKSSRSQEAGTRFGGLAEASVL